MRSTLFDGIRRVFRLGDPDRDVDEEIAFHFEATVAELVERGWTMDAARDEAQRRFGNERHWRREMQRIDRSAERRRRRADLLQTTWENVRSALRAIRRSPGFAAGVVLTFALGIGANATMFGIVDRTLLSPPAHIAAPDEVLRLGIDTYQEHRKERDYQQWLSYPDFEDFQNAKTLASVAAYARRDLTIGKGEEAKEYAATLATHELFPLLGVKPRLGRFYTPEEDRLGGARVAVLSEELWRRDYGGRADVLGNTLDFGKGPWTIIGVAPEGFTGINLNRVDVWLPLRSTNEAMSGVGWATSRNWWWLRIVGRMAPGATAERVATELTVLHRQGRAEQIESGKYDRTVLGVAAPVLEARGPEAPPEAKVALWLAGVSLLVLLIACANVANLLLARAIRQRREIAVRLALGISRRRLLAQLLTESLVLSVFGAMAALIVTRWSSDVVRTVLLPEEMYWPDSGIGGRVPLLAAGLALVAGLVSGIVPAVQASSPGLGEVLKSGSRSVTGAHNRTRNTLTVLQSALSVLLLIGAGLFIRSLNQVSRIDLGFDPAPVMTITPIYHGEPEKAEKSAVMNAAAERLRRVPGVEAVAGSVSLPFWSMWGVGLQVPGVDSVPRLETGGPLIHAVDPSYFETMDLAVVRGRPFTEQDGEGSPPVVLVNQTMAKVLWPGAEALGKCMYINWTAESEQPRPACAEVIGIVEDSRRGELIEGESMAYYVSIRQKVVDEPAEYMLVRVAGEPREQSRALLKAMLADEPRLRYAELRPFQEIIDPDARSWRLGATMFSIFGALALLVAAIGLYSLLAFSVAQRTHEFGIRAALGAPRQRLIRLVLSQGMRLVAAGVGLGILVAMLVAPRLEDMLYEVSPRDPLTFGLVALALITVAAAAAALPALRATRVDPQEALRGD